MMGINIYVVSGGQGTSGERIVRATLAQFQGVDVPIHIVHDVRELHQVDEVVGLARANNGMIVHTLVNTDLRTHLINLAHTSNVLAIDLQGQLLLQLTRLLGQQPAEQPGLYRRLRDPYFKRIEAMEFAVDHDDGRRPEELHLAELVLTGVSRVGKTPLSMYLSTQGWRVANVPLVREVDPPAQLFEINPHRVVGLTIEPGQLVAFRQYRQQRLGLSLKNNYSRPDELYDEVGFAEKIFRRGGFTVINVTDRPIEETSEEIIARVTTLLKNEH
ncbi:MAG: kinase/pyrophosphorylase [Anaerolineae bacterium]|nr:kinase/pyrophosphorylase [Anaerolineae bacterium]MBN8618958.1 kinase/pyrophosphorylase [Anaerolineae bacterium]